MLFLSQSNRVCFSFSEYFSIPESIFKEAASKNFRFISGFDLAYISVVVTEE